MVWCRAKYCSSCSEKLPTRKLPCLEFHVQHTTTLVTPTHSAYVYARRSRFQMPPGSSQSCESNKLRCQGTDSLLFFMTFEVEHLLLLQTCGQWQAKRTQLGPSTKLFPMDPWFPGPEVCNDSQGHSLAILISCSTVD